MKLIPGDPFLSQQNMPREILKSLYSHYGLDKPLYVQYFKYIKGFLTFDFGPSFIFEARGVNQIIKDGFFYTFILGLEALFISLFFGITLGCLAAFKKNKFQDSLIMFFLVIAISVPNFLFASLLQYIFAMKLNLFPIARLTSFMHSILPAISLAALPSAYIARLTRSSMIEVLKSDYIKTAISKGLSNFDIIFKHALKNAILPVIAYIGPITAHLLTGSFIIEKIFSIPGIGSYLVSSIASRDYTIIIGLSVFFSFVLIVIMFFMDIIYRLIDPRIDKMYKEN
jgi:oligopeptide transport system permease protein